MSEGLCVLDTLKDIDRSEDYVTVQFEGLIEEGAPQEVGQQILAGCSMDGCAGELEFFRDTPQSTVGDLNLDSFRVCRSVCKMRRK